MEPLDHEPLEAGDGPADLRLAPGDLPSERERLRVRLASFEGPLDLLLHLVRVNQVDIHDIPIVEIARQYDAHLEMMRQLDLTVAGEFLVMAATLAYIKSRALLPARPTEGGDRDDPRLALTDMLLEHQRFVAAAESLGARADVQATLWARPATGADEFADEPSLEVSLFDLMRAFRALLEQVGQDAGLELEADGLSVERRMEQLLGRLPAGRMVPFAALFPEERRKRDLIVTFLALLELLRLRRIAVWQSGRFGEIRVARAPAAGGEA
jgi:segregation and condensation protein A